MQRRRAEDRIPFNRPYMAGGELNNIARAVAYSNISGDGHFTQECAQFLESQFGIPTVLMTTSATSALELAMMLCKLEPGDEVIVPSFTFVSTASAAVRAGGTPVFVDIRADTLNLDENLVELAITERTRAIVPVHYAGVPCEMDRLVELAQRHDLIVVEDAAQAVNAFYRGRAAGSLGHLAAFSFHETKNLVCGEGGALCVNRRELLERAEVLRDKGTDRQQFFRGQVDKYTWRDIGSSFVPSEIVTAFLAAQFQALPELTRRRAEIYTRYQQGLAPLEARGLLRLPRVPAHCTSNHHMFFVLMPDQTSRDGLIAYLAGRNIAAVFHYVPLHSSPMGRQCGRTAGPLPVTDSTSDRLVRLPFFHELAEADQDRVIDAVREYAESPSVRRTADAALVGDQRRARGSMS